MDENTKPVDPEIVDLVDHIRNRHGAYGLRQLIDLAEREMRETQTVLTELADSV